MLVVASLTATGCTAAQKSAVGDYLTGIVGRVDLGQVLSCSEGLLFDASDSAYRKIGSCLAGTALNFVGNELKHAIDQAIAVARAKAGGGPRGLSSSRVSEEQAITELQLQLGLAIEAST